MKNQYRDEPLPLPSAEVLHYRLEYRAGWLHWKRAPSRNTKVGDLAGGKDAQGYWVVKIDRQAYKAHRIIWKMHHGTDPLMIDHINGDRSDNRIENLRSVTGQENNRARSERLHPDRKLPQYVYEHPPYGYTVKGAGINLGFFGTLEKALDARKQLVGIMGQ